MRENHGVELQKWKDEEKEQKRQVNEKKRLWKEKEKAKAKVRQKMEVNQSLVLQRHRQQRAYLNKFTIQHLQRQKDMDCLRGELQKLQSKGRSRGRLKLIEGIEKSLEIMEGQNLEYRLIEEQDKEEMKKWDQQLSAEAKKMKVPKLENTKEEKMVYPGEMS